MRFVERMFLCITCYVQSMCFTSETDLFQSCRYVFDFERWTLLFLKIYIFPFVTWYNLPISLFRGASVNDCLFAITAMPSSISIIGVSLVVA